MKITTPGRSSSRSRSSYIRIAADAHCDTRVTLGGREQELGQRRRGCHG
jgi:hypothetical protein